MRRLAAAQSLDGAFVNPVPSANSRQLCTTGSAIAIHRSAAKAASETTTKDQFTMACVNRNGGQMLRLLQISIRIQPCDHPDKPTPCDSGCTLGLVQPGSLLCLLLSYHAAPRNR